MRIVTRPDFDGIVCAVLLRFAEDTDPQIYWVEPNEIQQNTADIKTGDILANLPYSEACSLWFDHHISNKPQTPFSGAFDIAPSAARVIYQYYRSKSRLDGRYDALLDQTDIIDAARLTRDQVGSPEKYPYILLSMTIKNDHYKDVSYWNKLVALLAKKDITEIMAETEVASRCRDVVTENKAFESHLLTHTRMVRHVSITDFRSLDTVPDGNRFLTYRLFPDSIASVKIRFDSREKKNIQVSVGKSIFNPGCRVNIGKLLSKFGGGGHDGAGGVTLRADTAEKALEKILETLFENKST